MRVPLAFLFAGAVFPLAAAGEETANPNDSLITEVSLQDMVVTPTRNRRKLEEVPRAVNFVDQKALGERMPRNAAEALREEAGIQVQKTEHGGGNAIIRGMGSSQVLLLVDGMRLNNGTYRFGNHPYITTVDFGMLDRIEVVRGPGSTLYGSDAMGGTVNLITRNPVFAETGLTAGGRAFARYASADEEKIVRAEANVAGQGFGITAGAAIKEAKDLKRGTEALPWGQGPVATPGAAQPHSGYSGQDYDLKLAVSPVDRHRFTLGWQSTARPLIPRYDRYEDPGFYRWNYTDQERDLAYLQYELSGQGAPVRAFASFHRQERTGVCGRTARSFGPARRLPSHAIRKASIAATFK
jgi:outer membrane receptor protein involved in Fe transport